MYNLYNVYIMYIYPTVFVKNGFCIYKSLSCTKYNLHPRVLSKLKSKKKTEHFLDKKKLGLLA